MGSSIKEAAALLSPLCGSRGVAARFRICSRKVRGFAWSVPVTRVWTNTWASAGGSYRPILLVAAIGAADRPIRPATENGSAIRGWWIVTIRDAFNRAKCPRTPRNCSEADVAGARAAMPSSAIRIESREDGGEADDGREVEEEGALLLSQNGERSPELTAPVSVIGVTIPFSPSPCPYLSLCRIYRKTSKTFRRIL